MKDKTLDNLGEILAGVLAYIVLPFLILYWGGILIWLTQAHINTIRMRLTKSEREWLKRNK